MEDEFPEFIETQVKEHHTLNIIQNDRGVSQRQLHETTSVKLKYISGCADACSPRQLDHNSSLTSSD